MELIMTPLTEEQKLVSYTKYRCEINDYPIIVYDNHSTGQTVVYFQDNTRIQFRNQITSRSNEPYNEWLLRKLSKFKNIKQRLAKQPQNKE